MKKFKKRDWYVLLSMLMVLAGFAVNALLAYGDHTPIPDVVNGGWFAFWTVEIYRLSSIKIAEGVKHETETYE